MVKEDPAVIASEISLNVASLVETTRAFLPEMLAAGRGALINVASTAAFQPVPGMAVYGATKAFVLSFTEAVAHETKESGLRVLALCPGATRTEFFDVLGSQAAAVGRLQGASEVIDTALRALDRRTTPVSVAGQNGFRLSLLGFDPEFDYDNLLKEGRGRRVMPAAPGREPAPDEGHRPRRRTAAARRWSSAARSTRSSAAGSPPACPTAARATRP